MTIDENNNNYFVEFHYGLINPNEQGCLIVKGLESGIFSPYPD